MRTEDSTPFVTIDYGGGLAEQYRLDEGGKVLGTDRALEDGTPDWDAATIVDVGQIADLEWLSRATLELLLALGAHVEGG